MEPKTVTVEDYLESLRDERGWTWRDVCRKAGISNGTLSKIREKGSDGAGRAYVTRLENALEIPPGTIERVTREGNPAPPEGEANPETELERGPSKHLKKGEVLYTQPSADGVKYRLEISPGYGVTYIWSKPQEISSVAVILRAMAKVAREVGEVFETEAHGL
ncbi:helix-turn-helix domain-containing protein [Nocardiopsis synnemataformans]|uniref:helix-turn-helix domain-containing protein n=1 Tax=Nocardiopsis synnemataformans TaxID=61305 RepID=UPI003EC1483E